MSHNVLRQELKRTNGQSPVSAMLFQASKSAAIIVDWRSKDRKLVDAVHDFRVALRRLHVVSVAFAGKLPGPVSRKLKRRTKKLRHCAGNLRDHDIMCAMLVDLSRQSPRDDDAIAAVQRHLQARRVKLLSKLQRALKRPKTKRLWAWIKDTVLPELDVSRWPDTELRSLAMEQFASRLAELRTAQSLMSGDTRDSRNSRDRAADLHALRISAKRLRYVIELFDGFGCQIPGSAVRDEAEALQDKLGCLQDLVVLAAYCREASIKSKWTKHEQAQFLKVSHLVNERYLEELAKIDVRQASASQLTSQSASQSASYSGISHE